MLNAAELTSIGFDFTVITASSRHQHCVVASPLLVPKVNDDEQETTDGKNYPKRNIVLEEHCKHGTERIFLV